jgi:hypothetical protein
MAKVCLRLMNTSCSGPCTDFVIACGQTIFWAPGSLDAVLSIVFPFLLSNAVGDLKRDYNNYY